MIPDYYDPRQVGELFLVADAALTLPRPQSRIGPREAAWQSTPCPLGTCVPRRATWRRSTDETNGNA